MTVKFFPNDKGNPPGKLADAELHFTERMWPEFGAAELAGALEEFRARERRFGTVPKAAAG